MLSIIPDIKTTSTKRPLKGGEKGNSPSKKQRKMQNKKKPTNTLTGRWTKDEHEKFLDGIRIYGKEWKKIASMIDTRTVVQIRTHAQKYFQKLAKKRNQALRLTPMRPCRPAPTIRKSGLSNLGYSCLNR